jgi:hypothetical protein
MRNLTLTLLSVISVKCRDKFINPESNLTALLGAQLNCVQLIATWLEIIQLDPKQRLDQRGLSCASFANTQQIELESKRIGFINKDHVFFLTRAVENEQLDMGVKQIPRSHST